MCWLSQMFKVSLSKRSKKALKDIDKRISKRINNKEIINMLKSIKSEFSLNQILSDIHKKIKSSSN